MMIMDGSISANRSIASLGDYELLSAMKRIAAGERVLSVYAIAYLGEIQRRKLYEDEGFPTMFSYCVGELRYSEATAFRRIQAAAAALRFPEVLAMIKDGGLTVCSLAVIAPHLTHENKERVLKQIEGKSVRHAERLRAELQPLPDTRDTVRSAPATIRSAAIAALDIRTPAAAPGAATAIPSRPQPPQKIMPRAPARVQFSFTGSEELRRVIDRLRELLWHKYPDGRLEDILLEAGRTFLALKDPDLLPPAKVRPPRAAETRAVPRWVRSAVYRRDGGRCAFTSADGRRCETRRSLEYDHIMPWALGGRSDDPKNIRLLCRAHNQRAARING